MLSASRVSLVAARGASSFSYTMKSVGVSSIDSATTSISRSPMADGITACCTTKEISTKPNSPACDSDRENSWLSRRFRRNALPSAYSTAAFTTMTPTVMPRMVKNSLASSPKFMPAPTVMKNSPSSRPLKGSSVLSRAWRYSLSASTTPARKAPSAGDRPTRFISAAMPTTSISAKAVYTSRRRDSAM